MTKLSEMELPYCSDCNSCGEPLCCPDTKCKYWQTYVVDYCETKLQENGLGHISKGDSFDYGYRIAMEELIKYTKDNNER